MVKLWIDAAAFDDFGGWTLETQFVGEMGQAYLLASNIPGELADDASVRFTLTQSGTYRFWVRTKNWLPDYSPGTFCLAVNSIRQSRLVAKADVYAWHWEAACDVYLTAGENTLSVCDVGGWFARFAAVIITDDFDFTPSPQTERLLRTRSELLHCDDTVDEGHFDILVAGAGPGGVPAALAAARHGCSVALIHSRPHIGGNASDEALVSFDGAGAFHSGMRETGIADEIKRTHDFYSLSWQQTLERLVSEEKNIRLYTNLLVTGADTVGSEITQVSCVGCVDGTKHSFTANEYIDCTGDGWLAYYAGAQYRVGREPKWMYDESYAPEAPDECTMSGCLMGTLNGRQALSYRAVDTGSPVEFRAPEWAVVLSGDLGREPLKLTSGAWWLENRNDIDDLWEQERARDELIRLSLGYFDWLKNKWEHRERARNLAIVRFPAYNAKRESRRIIGDTLLTQNDITRKDFHPEAIAYAGWTMDVHSVKGLFSG
ncbi:MAG TPA: FAD-dependent oxidoreductase, partial [Bacillota bacterium]|nr:FAD-dependent oxidoreductase [Bacillota bacterium]